VRRDRERIRTAVPGLNLVFLNMTDVTGGREARVDFYRRPRNESALTRVQRPLP